MEINRLPVQFKWSDVIAVTLLVLIALCVRIHYQHESIIRDPIQKDAKDYFIIAYNLSKYGVYSNELATQTNIPPKSNFRRPPGYPLFLYPFAKSTENIDLFLNRVSVCQAILGSLSAIAAFLLARFCVSVPWAFLVGLLTGLSPHLVAMDHFLLSETLFTFTLVCAVLLFVLSLKRDSTVLIILAGVLFGTLPLVRSIALLLGPFLAVFFLFFRLRGATSRRLLLFIQVLCFFLGYLLIYGPYYLIKINSASDAGHVARESSWEHIIRGADVDLKNLVRAKKEPALRAKTEKMIQDKRFGFGTLKERFMKDPSSYIRWYLGGKLFFMWQWDNIYIGDVYHYPMIKKGFDTSKILRGIHTCMLSFHWPIYLMALFSPFIFYGFWRNRATDFDVRYFWVFFLIFGYFAMVLTLLMPLPRYGIPLRPFVYLLAVLGFRQIWLGCYRVVKHAPA